MTDPMKPPTTNQKGDLSRFTDGAEAWHKALSSGREFKGPIPRFKKKPPQPAAKKD